MLKINFLLLVNIIEEDYYILCQSQIIVLNFLISRLIFDVTKDNSWNIIHNGCYGNSVGSPYNEITENTLDRKCQGFNMSTKVNW